MSKLPTFWIPIVLCIVAVVYIVAYMPVRIGPGTSTIQNGATGATVQSSEVSARPSHAWTSQSVASGPIYQDIDATTPAPVSTQTATGTPTSTSTSVSTHTPTRSTLTVGQRKTPSPTASSPDSPPGTATAVSNSPLEMPLSASIESAVEVIGQLLDVKVETLILTDTAPISYTATSTLYLPVVATSNLETQSESITTVTTATVPSASTAFISPVHPVPNFVAPSIFPEEQAEGADDASSGAEEREAMSEPSIESTDGASLETEVKDEVENDENQEDVPAVENVPIGPSVVTAQPTPDGVARTTQIPILMYHYLSIPPQGADIYRTDLSVAPSLFADHLDAMRAAGYQTITLYDLLAHLTQGRALPDKAVIITFDDGYRDNYTNALPLLVERNMIATFFIVTDFIDAELPEYVTWNMVREMHAAGMQIESHGRNHFSLENRNRDFLVWQALGSAETIEYELGVRPHFVSYPAGEYDELTIDVFHSANYWAGVTTVQGASHSSDSLFELKRIRVRNTTSVAELMRLLEVNW